MQIPLLEGAYSARGIIAAAQRCVNLYPEVNQREAFLALPQQVTPSLTTHYPTPGLRLLVQGPNAPVRGLYRANNNYLYTVIGNQIFMVNSQWQLQSLGYLAPGSGQVRFADNGQNMVVVDGSSAGYIVDLATQAMSTINDPAFFGGNTVTYLASYMFFNKPATQFFYSTTSGTILPFDGSYIAMKSSYGDKIVGLIATARQLWILGELTTEIWYLNGGATFPVAETPNGMIQTGCIAPYSIASMNDSVFWLSETLNGGRIVLTGSGYNASRVSTHAIENELSKYARVDDAVGFCYQQQGHTFYQLTFPSADKTWVYDGSATLTGGLWHERASYDAAGTEHRHRANCGVYCYDTNVVGDFANGSLYAYDLNKYTDNGSPIRRVRGFPHLLNDGKRVYYQRFVADMQCGTATSDVIDLDVILKVSDNRGASWAYQQTQSLGGTGELLVQPQFRRLGMARDRVFELSWTAPVFTALNGAFVDAVTGAA